MQISDIMDKSIKRRNRRRGQAAIETVMVIVPLMMMLISIIDLSVAIFVMDTLEYAARQGVRYAITDNTAVQDGTGTGPSNPAVNLAQVASIQQAVRDNSLGFLASAPASQIVVTFYQLMTTGVNVNTWQVVTGAGSNSGGNLVKVSITGYSWAWAVPYFRGQAALSMNAAATDIMGGCPNSVCPTE
jgi:Flp pilus assembly protein TadG